VAKNRMALMSIFVFDLMVIAEDNI